MSPDPHHIATVDELRAIIGEPAARTFLKLRPSLSPQARAFLARCPYLVMGTAAPDGAVSVTPRGDAAGFVLVEDDHTLVIPERHGNRLAYALVHILAGSKVALFAMLPGTGETLRITGSAVLTRDPALLERLATRGKPALLAIRVTVDTVYFHCAKASLRAQLWQPERWPEPFAVQFARDVTDDEEVIARVDRTVAQDYEEL